MVTLENWSTVTQFFVIGMAAFCISFGAIYSLIFCYKRHQKQGSTPEETARLTEELLRGKVITRRKSTSLTSPPMSEAQPVVNPHYSGSPYKVPQRHLRSTSATYSPTHYLSPHHRRNSTPTHQGLPSECSCCGCPRGSNNEEIKHSMTIPSPLSLSSLPLSSSFSTPSVDPEHLTNTCHCGEENGIHGEADLLFLSTHKCKLIPVKPKAGRCEDNRNHNNYPKSFSFGPIPAARKGRISLSAGHTPDMQNQNQNENANKDLPCITLTKTPTFTMTKTNVNLGLFQEAEEWEERVPLLQKADLKDRNNPKILCHFPKEEKEKNEKETEKDFKDDNDGIEIEMNKADFFECPNNNRVRGEKNYPKVSKEERVLQNIPFYVDEEMCN